MAGKPILFANKVCESLAEILNTRPLAVFSAAAFVFSVLRLFTKAEPLLVAAFFIGLVLIGLNVCGKTDTFITVFICISVFLGMFASAYRINVNKDILQTYDGSIARLYGSISSVPDKSEETTSFVLDCKKIYANKGEYSGSIKIYVQCDEYYKYEYGDKLILNAELCGLPYNNSISGNGFLSKGILLKAKNVKILSVNDFKISENIPAYIRNYILRTGDKFFKNEESMLFKALAAGDRSSFSDKLKNDLNSSGLMHIACVSGLHISILGMAVYELLKKRNRYAAAIISIALIFLFAAVTGMNPSTIRAATMFAIFMIAKISLRDDDKFTSLLFAAMLLVLVNPYVIYDFGFILSFMSVLGIQIFADYFKSCLSFMPKIVRESMSVTLSAQIMTIPVIANLFGYLSVYAVLSNIVISFVFVYILYFCLLFIPISSVPFLNRFFAAICAFLLHIISAVAYFFASLPMSTVNMNGFSFFDMAVYYMIVLMFVFRKKLSAYFIGFALMLCSLFIIMQK